MRRGFSLRSIIRKKLASRSDLLWPLLVSAGQMLNGWKAEHNYRSFPSIPLFSRSDPPYAHSWPGISVIVPARNEAHNLPALLSSLVKQQYPLYEVIVIDDASTDETAAVVRSYADDGVRLLQSAGPLAGWTGKNHACWLGAKASLHPWLLFIDADTALHPLALRSTLAFVLEQQIEVLSLFPRQRCESFWERLLLPFAYQNYFVGVHARSVHALTGPALANGQYFLIKDTAYQSIGGHSANPASITDDVSLATSLKQAGSIPFVARGESLVSVRMYTRLREISEGFGKNAYLFLTKSPLTGLQTALSTWLAAAVPWLFVEAVYRRSPWRVAFALLAYLSQVVGIRSWHRRFNVSPLYSFLTPLASWAFLGIALGSMGRVLTGRKLAWKGRRYSAWEKKSGRYRLPLQWILEMGQAMWFKRERSIVADSALAIRSLPVAPRITGLEYLPAQGSFVLVANHYQRSGLWIGWSGAALIEAVTRPRNIEIQVVTTDRARIGRFEVPGTRWIFERVAVVWGLQRVTPNALVLQNERRQRYVLLHLMRRLRRSEQHPVCIIIMPEGDEGNASGLVEAAPGSGRALAALSSTGIPLVPAAVWEEDGRLQVNFGEPFSLSPEMPVLSSRVQDRVLSDAIMCRIARLLPPALRGRYAAKVALR